MALSPILQITQVAPNQTAKEATINDGFSRIERSLNDIKTISFAAGNVTLNMADYTVAFLFSGSGHTVSRDLTVPDSKRLFAVYNAGTGNIVVKNAGGGGTDATVPPGSFCVLYNNETDIKVISDSAASGAVTSLLDLPEVPSSFAGHAGDALVINGTEDGLDFGTISVGLADLDDGPGSYTGAAGKAVKVNASGTGFEFATYVNEFKELTDAPASYTGQAEKLVRVKADESGLEFVEPPEQFVFETRDYVLTNAGFEEGDTSDWTLPGTGGTWAAATVFGDIVPAEGVYLCYHGYGQGTTTTHLEYEVDLTTQGTPTELDSGAANINVVVAMASDNADIGYIILDFLNGSSALISSEESTHYESIADFLDRTLLVPIPSGSRTLVVKLYAESNPEAIVDPDSLAFAYDDLRVSLKLETEQVTAFTQLTDAPSAYGGHGGKVVRVNSGATALEFGGQHNFLGLDDTPDDYTGLAGFVARVNSGATGMELVDLAFTDLADAPATLIGNAGQLVKVNTTATALEFAPPQQEVEISVFTPGVLANSQILLAYIPTKDISLPINLAGSTFKSLVAATASTTIDIKKNGSNVGTIVFSAAGTTGAVTMASAQTFDANTDTLSLVGPASADATLADIICAVFGDVV